MNNTTLGFTQEINSKVLIASACPHLILIDESNPSTVIRDNEIHKMYDEILNELGDWPLSCLGTMCMAG